MSRVRHPYPWRVGGLADTAIVDAKGQVVVEGGQLRQDEAPLVAAAPEMLDALKGCAAMLAVFSRPGKGLPPLAEKVSATIQAAIAKAEGRD